MGDNRVKVRVIQGPMAGSEFTFGEHDTLIVGRDPKCPINLPKDPCVSRHHLILEVCPPEVRLRDLGSRNGTYVIPGSTQSGTTRSGLLRRVDGDMELSDGDTIQVGETVLHVSVKGEAQTTSRRCQSCGRDFQTRELPKGYRPAVCPDCVVTTPGPPPADAESHDDDAQDTVRSLEALAHAGYQIERELGRGGMAIVYLARRPGEPAVAVKTMLPRHVPDARAAEMFLREMDLLKSLHHPNIVRLHGARRVEEVFCFEMEYCSGGSVGKLAKRHQGRLPLRETGMVMLAALNGIAHAHSMRMVHRDIKPENILLHRDEQGTYVKVCDFGLAKNFDKAGLSGITATGVVGGTLSYMPREQLLDYKHARPVCDVWSAAATFYHLLTAAYPREVKPGMDPVRAVLESQLVSVRERGVEVPVAVSDVVDRALSLNPEQRYQTAADFRAALEGALKSGGVL